MPDLGHLVDLPFTPVATSIRCPRFNTNNSLSIEYQWLLKTFSTKYNSFMNTKTSKPFSLEPQSTNSQGTQFSHGVRLRCTWEEATTGQRQVGGKYSVFRRIPSPLAKIIILPKLPSHLWNANHCADREAIIVTPRNSGRAQAEATNILTNFLKENLQLWLLSE